MWGKRRILPTPDEEYSLYQEGIFDDARKLPDREWFIKCIAYTYRAIGDDYDCVVQVSKRRLGEVYDFWQEDTSRALNEGSDAETEELDQFKHASFIAFWLRRLCPINEVYRNQSYPDGTRRENVSTEQAYFLRYGNELCAFVVGYQLCQFYHAMDLEDRINESGGDVVAMAAQTEENLRSWNLDANILADFVMILKHKNISPQAIYITYRALFSAPRRA